MAWTIRYAASVQKSLRAIDKQEQNRIREFLETRLAHADNPRQLGKALQGKAFAEIWRYRVGDYRILAQIIDAQITIIVVRIGHRKDVYR